MKKRIITRLRTDFLSPRKGFLDGMCSIFDLSGSYFEYNTSESGAEADRKALSSDWGMIGQDIEDARVKLEKMLVKNSNIGVKSKKNGVRSRECYQ